MNCALCPYPPNTSSVPKGTKVILKAGLSCVMEYGPDLMDNCRTYASET